MNLFFSDYSVLRSVGNMCSMRSLNQLDESRVVLSCSWFICISPCLGSRPAWRGGSSTTDGFACKDSEIFTVSHWNKAVLQMVCNMSTLVFLFFRVECVLCDNIGSNSCRANRGFNLALYLLLQEVPGTLTYVFEIKTQHWRWYDSSSGFCSGLWSCWTVWVTLFMKRNLTLKVLYNAFSPTKLMCLVK